MLRLLRSLGLTIVFWTVNTQQDARAAAGFADIVVTDQVAALRKLLYRPAAGESYPP
jgi:hypothetical protein